MNKSIIVLVNFDAAGKPFAKVSYDSQVAPYLDEEHKKFANLVARRAAKNGYMPKPIYFSTEQLVTKSKNKIDLVNDLDYYIYGADHSKEDVMGLLSVLSGGASDKDVQARLYITDGDVPPILCNEFDLYKTFCESNYRTMNSETKYRKRIANWKNWKDVGEFLDSHEEVKVFKLSK